MSTLELTIDSNIFKFFIDDTQVQAKTITDALNAATHDPIQDEVLSNAIKAAQSISGGAKLCNLPLIPDLSEAVALTLPLLNMQQINSSDDLYLSLERALNLIDSLTTTNIDTISQWLNDNEPELTASVDYLNQQSNKPTQKTPVDKTEKSPVKAASVTKPTASKIDLSMLELFKVEAEAQAKSINENLLALETDPNNSSILEPLMRASHSIKGAARMINFKEIVEVSHRMEDCFVNSQNGKIKLDKAAIDLLLFCNDILETVSLMPNEQLPIWLESNQHNFENSLQMLDKLSSGKEFDISQFLPMVATETHNEELSSDDENAPNKEPKQNLTPGQSSDSSVRIKSERLNKMLAVSNELLVSQHWLQTHLNSLQLVKKRQTEASTSILKLRQCLEDIEISDEIFSALIETENRIDICRQSLNDDINQLDEYDRKSFVLSSRLNQEVIASRMRSFGDGTHGFKRMVRDVSQSLGKEVRLELNGLDTLVDSDILDKIEAPLTHLLRNAIDHGIEMPEVRQQNGKQPYGLISISAFHHAGRLNITIKDDGKGIDLDQLKKKIINKGMVNQQMADKLSESELLDFLFLPGFSTRENVTEFSGRGVGLDVVHNVTTSLRGQIKSSSKLGDGLTVQLQLPLTLSVLHSLLTDIGNEYYAFPLARIHTVIKLHSSEIYTLENKQLIKYNGQDVSLISGRQVLESSFSEANANELLEIIILSERGEYYAIVVDKIIGETNLALDTIDERLGKIKDISALAIADDGRPVLVLDIDDLLINIQELSGNSRLGNINRDIADNNKISLKKILVIDDSLTVREVEKNLLESKGYYVDIAIDGVDGWNTLKQSNYDLIITDIDMPRMNGIELVTMIKKDANLSTIPVMIVSYKDNPEDRQKGLEAGADYYLTKGSFHDEGLVDGVVDLIGEPTE